MSTKGGIRLMEVSLKEQKELRRALEVELGTFVPAAVYIGHHHQRRNFGSVRLQGVLKNPFFRAEN